MKLMASCPSWSLRVLRGWHLALFVWIALAPATLARSFGDGRLHLTVMDVGQGDAMLVTLPNGRTLMVDTGGVSLRGDFDIGDRVLGPALRARGIVRLDYLAITHGDPDHIGGAASLAKDFAPREVWAGTFVANHEPTLKLQAHRGPQSRDLAMAAEGRPPRPGRRRAARAPSAAARLGAPEGQE